MHYLYLQSVLVLCIEITEIMTVYGSLVMVLKVYLCKYGSSPLITVFS